MNSKPVLCVSKCLGFDACRYNGAMINDNFIGKLRNYVDFITICPEMEIGLGVPRESLRIINIEDTLHLIQPKTEMDLTSDMERFTTKFFGAAGEFDGFILKSRSPSCGVKDVKIYSSSSKGSSSEKGIGFFARQVLQMYPGYPIEDEGRLSNYKIREHFLTKLFTLYSFKSVKVKKSMDELLKFQAINKLLFMSYNQKEMKILGKIAANHEHKTIEDVLEEYEEHLKILFSKTARYPSNINVLQHAIGHFSKYITDGERVFLSDSLEKYRNESLPLSTPVYLVKSYAVRFNLDNLNNQTFFTPYPEELIELRDSGKGAN